jgi:hypothetical protein
MGAIWSVLALSAQLKQLEMSGSGGFGVEMGSFSSFSTFGVKSAFFYTFQELMR